MTRKTHKCPIGRRVKESDTARLVHVVGPRKFKVLQKIFGGRRIWVPKKGKQLTCGICGWRDYCIKVWRTEGTPVVSIAKRLSISPKSIYRVLQN